MRGPQEKKGRRREGEGSLKRGRGGVGKVKGPLKRNGRRKECERPS